MANYLDIGKSHFNCQFFIDKHSIQRSIVNHVEYTLACNRCNMNTHKAMLATSHSLRDRLIEDLNDTQTYMMESKTKCVNFLCIEYLIGRLLHQILLNKKLDDAYRDALQEMGYTLEDLYDEDKDAALENGGLGRLAACYMDSLSTMNIFGRYDSILTHSLGLRNSLQLWNVRTENRGWMASGVSRLLAVFRQSLGD